MILRLLMLLSNFCYLWLILCFVHNFPMANSEFYSSVDSLKTLGNMEATLIDTYRQYLKMQKQEIDTAKRFIQDVKLQHKLAREDIAGYSENPINTFTFTKRLVNDWKELFQHIQFLENKKEIKESLNQNINDNMKLVDENELEGAVKGLMSLQTVYKLSASDLANGGKYGNPLDWNDCFEIGAIFVDKGVHYLAIDWLNITLNKLQESKESDDIKSIYTNYIKEYLAISYQGVGEYKISQQHLENIITNNTESIAKLTKSLFLKSEYSVEEEDEIPEVKAVLQATDIYSSLCRGENLKKPQKLSCTCNSKLHPFFILSPLQVEPLLLDPEITVYHNLINDEQISKLLQLTQQTMKRSTVVIDNKSVPNDLRTSQQTWVDPKKFDIAKMMYKLVATITGFNMSNAEIMQVANYGIGGHYDEHIDWFNDGYYQLPQFKGNRISTNMFYLSNVEEGGHTAFTKLNVFAKPVKGSMIMWYNLHKSLKGDLRTYHAACPVLKGSKQIANIWTHSGYHEFVRPCGLKDDSVY